MASSLPSSTLLLSHSATMGSTAAAAVTEATEPVMDVSLDEYFEACQASSSSAPSSSRSSSSSLSEPATRSVGPSSRDAAVGDRSSATAALQRRHSNGVRNVKPAAAVAADLPTPLQGNVTRPLLQRPRPLRSPLFSDVLISIPSTLDDEGVPPHDASPSRSSTHPRQPFRKPESVAPPHGSAAAFSCNGAAVRGSAGYLLAECLQHTTLPCAPPFCSPPSCSTAVGHSCAVPPAWANTVFAFQPPPAGTAAARGKKRSSTTITTRGGASFCPSSTSPSTAPRAVAAAQLDCLARQRAVLFDVLCALRQHPTASCEMHSDKGDSRRSAHVDPSLPPSGGLWRLRDAVLAEAAAKAWQPTFLGALEQLLEVANIVAAVEAHVRECEPALAHRASRGPTEVHGALTHDVTEMCSDVQDASVALEVTAARSLERLCSVLRQLSADFGRWVLQLQEYLLVVCESAAAASYPSEHQPSPPLPENVRTTLYENEEEAPKAGGGRQYLFCTGSYMASSCGVAATVLPASCSLADLVAAVRENIVPLQRFQVLVEESGCFEGLARFDKRSSASRPASTTGAAAASGAREEAPPPLLSCALLAARLLDTLIIQASAFQDTSTMDLYRLYVMTLLYTAWPYVLLCTAAIFGFVRGIDPPMWRRQLPRLFRSSFSHVRIGDASRRFPTDILSLLLNCVGYYNSDGIAAAAAAGEKEKGMTQRTIEPFPSSAGRSGDSVGGVWMPGPRQAGAGRSGCRRGEASEQHVARAALTSARAFVLRSLASFTRRHKQIALSRTPMHPRRASAAPAGVKGYGATTAAPAAAASRTSAGTTPQCQPWHTKSMKEILHYIMHEAGDRQGDETGDVDQAGSGTVAAVVAYAQQNQDVRRRVVQVPAPSTAVAPVDATGSSNTGGSAGASHYVYFPTTIPLGFASMLTEAVAGQQQWHQRRGGRRVSNVADDQGYLAPSSRASSLGQRRASGGGKGIGRPRPLMWSDDGNATAAWDSNNGDDDGGDSGDEGGSALRRRGISLWTLAITDSDTTPDVRFANVLAGEEEQYLDAADTGSKVFGQGGQTQRKQRSHQLWINVTIPCARWITTALLIPIGVAVQRLQEHRLRDLFTLSLHAVAGRVDGSGGGCPLSRPLHEPVREAQQQRQSADTTAPVERPSPGSLAPLDGLAGKGLVSRTATPYSFIHALKLLVDVALCRDQERLVHGFLERLHREPRWWVRPAEDGGAVGYGRLGTAAPVVSAIFADALRGKRFSELVRLSVLPARVVAGAAAAATTTTAVTSTTRGQQGEREEERHSSPSVAADMLDVFASFQLDFALPDAFQRILQPRDLSVYVQPLTSTTERSYQTYFWQRRRRLYVDEGDAGEGRASPAAPAASDSNGIAFADVWSYVFGYKCALYYAQITLREHKKRLHQRDAQDAQVAQAMGLPGQNAAQHLRYVSRGLGTAYYTLNFAVEQLLSFMQNVAMRVVYNLERLLAKAMGSSLELLSCMELCYQLDALLLELSIVSFPARPPVALNMRERGMQSSAAEVVRTAVQRVLEVALDPLRLPVSHIRSSTCNAVEALVAAVSVAAENHPSTLATHLKPLVVRLTFNRYYGTDEEIRSFHFR